MQPTRHFTVKSLAEYWAVSTTHVYSLLASKQLGSVRIGKAWRIPQQCVLDYEAANTQSPIDQAGEVGNQDMSHLPRHASAVSAYMRGQQDAQKSAIKKK